MKAYKLEVLVIDFDGLGADGVKDAICTARYPNRCISPSVEAIQTADIGVWTDEHPLNNAKTCAAEYARLFPGRSLSSVGAVGVESRDAARERMSKKVLEMHDAPAVIGGAAYAQMAEQKEYGQVYGIIDPDYGRIYTMVRKLAWEEGYAIGLHGSFTRDLDMIAVPWDDGRRCNPEKLVARILQATGLKEAHGNPGIKPHGRKVWTLLLPEFGDPRFVDLSIMPCNSSPSNCPDNEGGGK